MECVCKREIEGERIYDKFGLATYEKIVPLLSDQ